MKHSISPQLYKNKSDIIFLYLRKAFMFCFPKNIWIAFVVVAIFLQLDGASMVGYTIANLLWFLYSVALAIIIHELGHFLAARLAGEQPWRVTLGKGNLIAKWDFFGIKLLVYDFAFVGAVYTIYRKVTYRKMRRFIIVLAGPLVNIIVALFCLTPWPSAFFISEQGMVWWPVFGLANLSLAISSLVPFKTQFLGVSNESDGRKLMRIPFLREDELAQSPLDEEWLRANDCIEDKRFEEALAIYQRFEGELDNNKIQYINIAVAYIRLGRYEEALVTLEKLLAYKDEADVKKVAVYIFHNLAYVFLLLDRLDEAWDNASVAKELARGFDKVDCLHAYLMVEKGKAKDALYTLEKNFDMFFYNEDSIGTGIMLVSAYLDLGNTKKALKIWNRLKVLEMQLDPDVRTIFKRVEAKVAIHHLAV